MNQVRYEIIHQEEDGQRLDNYLIRILKGVPKSHIYRIIRGGEVRINKKRAKPDTRLKVNDSVRIPPVRVAEETSLFVGEALKRKLQESILHEDAFFLVINKPAGIAVHGGSGVSLGVIEVFRQIRKDIHYLELAHRLDRETSGCLVMVKKRSVLRELQALFANRQITKTYWAVLSGTWTGKKNQLVEAPLQKNILKSGERVVHVSKSGKTSETAFKLLENYKEACFMEVIPKTGRTHQIRVHGAWCGNPVMGDEKYGNKISGEAKRLYLHARAVQFTLNGIRYRFQADVDDLFEETLEQLRRGAHDA